MLDKLTARLQLGEGCYSTWQAMLCYASSSGVCTASRISIAKRVGVTERVVIRHLAKLRAVGMLHDIGWRRSSKGALQFARKVEKHATAAVMTLKQKGRPRKEMGSTDKDRSIYNNKDLSKQENKPSLPPYPDAPTVQRAVIPAPPLLTREMSDNTLVEECMHWSSSYAQKEAIRSWQIPKRVTQLWRTLCLDTARQLRDMSISPVVWIAASVDLWRLLRDDTNAVPQLRWLWNAKRLADTCVTEWKLQKLDQFATAYKPRYVGQVSQSGQLWQLANQAVLQGASIESVYETVLSEYNAALERDKRLNLDLQHDIDTKLYRKEWLWDA